jgi:fumarylacetoacetase
MKSWVESANDPATDFPLENLPYGVFQDGIGVAIGDYALGLGICSQAGLLDGLSAATLRAAEGDSLNGLMALSPTERTALRVHLTSLLAAGQKQREGIGIAMVERRDAIMRKPVDIRDYTDFYASIFHATHVGRLFRPENPLLPNYKHAPIGYHGRASSIVVSGTEVRRPHGQIKPADAEAPVFAPTRSLDYEMEVGMYIARGNPPGQPIPIDEAESHIFGFSLVNDWSARDIQAWEYQPLGPFLGKSFATSVSPWVVTLEALAPFRSPAFARADGDPAPLPYLNSQADRERGGIDITLEVYLSSASMRRQGVDAVRVGRSNFRDLYWTPAQMLTHHASNGCNLQTGDLLASGTVSGEADDARGCLLEMTRRGEAGKFLEDGDEVILRGFCQREGARRIGFGECRGVISPA